MGARGPVMERLWRRVANVGGEGCWEWTGFRNPKGYGRINTGDGGSAIVHRLVLAEKLGQPLPSGVDACHRCDNPPCCNPAHLFAGTRLDNMRDAATKGRVRRGERSGVARLTDAQAADIVRRLDAGERQAALAREYGVVRATVQKIAAGETWQHVRQPLQLQLFTSP